MIPQGRYLSEFVLEKPSSCDYIQTDKEFWV